MQQMLLMQQQQQQNMIVGGGGGGGIRRQSLVAMQLPSSLNLKAIIFLYKQYLFIKYYVLL